MSSQSADGMIPLAGVVKGFQEHKVTVSFFDVGFEAVQPGNWNNSDATILCSGLPPVPLELQG